MVRGSRQWSCSYVGQNPRPRRSWPRKPWSRRSLRRMSRQPQARFIRIRSAPRKQVGIRVFPSAGSSGCLLRAGRSRARVLREQIRPRAPESCGAKSWPVFSQEPPRALGLSRPGREIVCARGTRVRSSFRSRFCVGGGILYPRRTKHAIPLPGRCGRTALYFVGRNRHDARAHGDNHVPPGSFAHGRGGLR